MTYDDAENFIKELQGLLAKWDAEITAITPDRGENSELNISFKNIEIYLGYSFDHTDRLSKVDIRVWA